MLLKCADRWQSRRSLLLSSTSIAGGAVALGIGVHESKTVLSDATMWPNSVEAIRCSSMWVGSVKAGRPSFTNVDGASFMFPHARVSGERAKEEEGFAVEEQRRAKLLFDH